MSRIKLFIPFIVFIVLAVFFWRGLSLDPNAMPSALIDQLFPDFNLPRLPASSNTVIQQGDNKAIDLPRLQRKDLLGKVSLVNVWASWCVACRYEHPVFNALAEKGVRIIGISYKDESAAAINWLAELGDPYVFNIIDREGTLGIDLGVFGAPETYLIDQEGVIRYKHVGIVDNTVWNTTLQPLYESLSR